MILSVEVNEIGQKNNFLPAWQVEILDPGERISLRDLVSSIVQQEVELINQQNQQNHQNRLSPVLSLQEIEESKKTGKVGFSEDPRRPTIDSRDAEMKALKAFDEGRYYIIVDDMQVENLDDEVIISADSKIVFIRLTPLVGG